MAPHLSNSEAYSNIVLVEHLKRGYSKLINPGLGRDGDGPEPPVGQVPFTQIPTFDNYPPQSLYEGNEKFADGDEVFKVGIVGAGVAGLFTALLLNEISEKVPEFKVSYDIFESSKRVGGRLYTHSFSDDKTHSKHDYYDVGAMRFPETAIMKR
jgi:hypothetical protein